MTDAAPEPPPVDSLYPDMASMEEQRRAFVFTALASADIDIGATLRACKAAEDYLASGIVPEPQGTKKLKVVT